MRHALDRRRARADDRNALVCEPIQQGAVWSAARIFVVPAAGMKGVAPEGFYARDARQFRHMKRSRPQTDETRREPVASIRLDYPARVRLVPLPILGLGIKQRVLVKTELVADAPAMSQNFWRVGIFLRRPVAGFLQERHIDHGRRIALRARVPIPVPGSPEIAALLNDAHVLHTRLNHTRASRQTREAAADECERHMISLGFALRDRRVRVVRETALQWQVLRIAVRTQALVALSLVFGEQSALVDFRLGLGAQRGGRRHPISLPCACRHARVERPLSRTPILPHATIVGKLSIELRRQGRGPNDRFTLAIVYPVLCPRTSRIPQPLR